MTQSVRLGMQIANVKQRQILPRVGKIWVRTPRCTSHLGVYAAKTAPTGEVRKSYIVSF